jgi:hypothetical protein
VSFINRRFHRENIWWKKNPRTRNQCEQVAADWLLARRFCTLKMEGIRSSETSVHTRSTRRHIPEDGILHSHRCKNLKSYISQADDFLTSKKNNFWLFNTMFILQ